MNCLPCTVGFHFECPDIHVDANVDLNSDGVEVLFICCCENGKELAVAAVRALKADEELRDVESTGRKRAKEAKPIKEGDLCEWAWLKNAGGGVKPIIGCKGNPATNIHHGPDKSTLNNDPDTNLHKICATCHNRWHTLNDPHYGERPPHGAPFLPLSGECLPHDTETAATELDINMNDFKWIAGEVK